MNIYFKRIIRSFRNKPIYSSITFVGFTIGITAALLIYLWVYSELNYDKFHSDYRSIYRVLTLSKQGDEVVKSPANYRPLPATLKQDYPQIKYAAFLSYDSESSPLQTEEGGKKIDAHSLWVSDDFFSIFNGFLFIEGNAFNAIQNPDGIILSKVVAQKLFGNNSALGKMVIIDKHFKKTHTVTGIVEVPKNSHINFGYILTEANSIVKSYSNNWGDKGWNRVYLKLHEDAQIDDEFMSQVVNQVSRYSPKNDKLSFQPLADIHLHSDYESGVVNEKLGSYKYVLIFSGLALLIMLMAVFNFSVLSVARASERSREIGIKKVNGANRWEIAGQFMSESILQTIMASAIAIVLISIALPWFNQLSGKELQLTLSLKLISTLLLITLSTGFLAGIYPSFVLSSLNPIGIFRGNSISGSRTKFIQLLVSVQFLITIVFIVATIVFVKQFNYIRNKDLGLNRDNIVVVPTGLWYDSSSFKAALRANSNILEVSASAYAPVDFGFQQTLALNHKGGTDSLDINLLLVDEDFAKTYQLQVIKGEFLNMDFSGYWKEREKEDKAKKEGPEYTVSIPVVINETAERMLGFVNPIGQRVGDNVIVGVVKDFNYRPLHKAIGPVIMMNDPESIMTMNIKIAATNKLETLQFIRDTYHKFRDNREFSYQFFDNLLEEKYENERQLKNISTGFALLAIIISVLGIFGMTVFSIEKRVKEIGIRKINGATISEVLFMLNVDFLKWVFVAFIIATPIAYYIMTKWLENFAYKTALSWWIFALAGLSALIIALFTVSWQSWRAASRNPVKALRYE